MTKPAFYDALEPFVSLTLAEVSGVSLGQRLERCLLDVKEICLAEDEKQTSNFEFLPESPTGPLRAMWYKRQIAPAWTKDGTIKDVQHHLVLALRRHDHLALHVTDSKLKGPIRTALLAQVSKKVPLSWLSPVPRATMSAAFLQNGQAKTLWLSGIHRRSATKADAKILAGQDLDYSLDPFDDQSFYWSAARSRSTSLDLTVGVSPRASRVWLRKAHSIVEFATDTGQLIDAVRGAKKTPNEPFRFLASPLESLDPTNVVDAYDVSILPPDMLDDSEVDAATTNAEAALILQTNLIAQAAGKADVAIEVEINGAVLGTLTLHVEIARDGKVKYKANDVKASAVNDKSFGQVKSILVRGIGVNIRYDSGHTVSDRQVYSPRMQRIGFDHHAAEDFSSYNVKLEKPSSLKRIGQEDSLFCWVQKTHKGWLACDDGANEKADFIHLDESGPRPVLSLIHVKGAKSISANRKLSVAAYEVVTGQAIKNLQWLDKEALAEGLRKTARASNYWWKDGKPVPQSAFVAAIDALGDFIGRVVIVQPHVTEAAHQVAVKATKGANRLRLDQLNTLLASAWRSTNGLGFEFKVIWSK
ncbi:hypothetical protein [Reyranella sp.]|uniref:hypothetical protein n=1 Tax=Reyranella sp. TaxID=1929291 RepID=UPI003BABFE96